MVLDVQAPLVGSHAAFPVPSRGILQFQLVLGRPLAQSVRFPNALYREKVDMRD